MKTKENKLSPRMANRALIAWTIEANIRLINDNLSKKNNRLAKQGTFMVLKQLKELTKTMNVLHSKLEEKGA